MKKQKLAYRRIRVSLPVKTGGAHAPKKGGKYHRQHAKEETRRCTIKEAD